MPMAQKTRKWTLAELHRLPDDGNRYELVRGELFVTPPPSPDHEELATVLHEILAPFVRTHRLGRIYRPRAVIQAGGSQAEPDLMVRVPKRVPPAWNKAAVPILVVEVLSDSTRRRDQVQKRKHYEEIGIPEYWIVDGEERTIRIVRTGEADIVTAERLDWRPAGAPESLVIDVRSLFREALG